MNKKMIFTALWIACGVFNWGAVMANETWEQIHYGVNIYPHGAVPRNITGLAAFEALAGPAGTVVSLGMTNFLQHGWYLWPNAEQRRPVEEP